MSSPIALARKAAPKKALVNLHRTLSHGHRVHVLAHRLAVHRRARFTRAPPHRSALEQIQALRRPDDSVR